MGMDMDRIYVLHGRGGSPEGSAKTIADLLPSGLPPVIRPTLPHCDPEVTAEESYAQFGLYPNSLVIGISLGGLLAAKFQEDHPDFGLKVVTLVSPTHAEGLALTRLRPDLIALYSTEDPVIGTCANWEDFTDNAFNVPWMKSHNIDNQKHSIALFLTEMLQGNDPREIVESIHQFPA
jgi:pimeloyl-ACP methyl ester carboxylesterase